MTAAVSELETQYADQAKFVIVSPEETQAAVAELEEFGFSDQKHGLVIFDAAGEAVVKMPGHNFKKPEIEKGLKDVLEG